MKIQQEAAAKESTTCDFFAKDSAELDRAHKEISGLRQAELDEFKQWRDEVDDDDHLVGEIESAMERCSGVDGDFAHWVWVFELSESERELFRRAPPGRRDRFMWAAGALEFQVPAEDGVILDLGLAICEPGGAHARRVARAACVGMALAKARNEEDAPFFLAGSQPYPDAPQVGRLRQWNEVDPPFDRTPWFKELGAVYPDIGPRVWEEWAEQSSLMARDALPFSMLEAMAQAAILAPQGAPEAQALLERLSCGESARSAFWPSQRLRAWIEACDISSAAPSAPTARAQPRL
jgi:hypothetical protein